MADMRAGTFGSVHRDFQNMRTW